MSATPVRLITPRIVRAAHHAYVLENGVKCIIIQDAEAKMAAASMSIQTGQLQDPESLPGLAHFCEHMLFMGTAKYPNEDDYDSYISKNGGFCNAWTAQTATTYFFTVGDEALDGAIDRFVEFFVAPSFNASSVAREVQAVHSEDEKNRTMDYWRVNEIQRLITDSRHPFHLYSNGNITTLCDEPKERGIDVRKELLRFYDTNYCAEGACLAVYSRRAPEEVLALVTPALSRMKRGTPPSFSFAAKLGGSPSMIDAAYRAKWLNVRTVKKTRGVSLSWCVRSPAATSWRSMPYAYVSHVIGHECDCSALGVMKKEGWATEMVFGPSRMDDDYELLSADITLTTKGFGAVEQVISLMYQAIGQLKRIGHVDEAVYAQMKAENELAFQTSEVSSPYSHCATLSANANATTLAECWVGQQVILEDDMVASFRYLDYLTPENCTVMLKWGDIPLHTDIDMSLTTERGAEKDEGCTSDAGDEEASGDDEKGGAAVEPCVLFATLPSYAQMPPNRQTRFNQTAFSVSAIPNEVLALWGEALVGPACHKDLGLPPPNPYLATDFTVYPPAEARPAELREVERFDCPHGVFIVRKDDGLHNTFKTSILWKGLSPVCYASPLNRFFSRVMNRLIMLALSEISYFGLLASLENNVSASLGGVSIMVEGPLQSLPGFFASVLSTALSRASLVGSRETYETYAEEVRRSIEEMRTEQPYKQALGRLSQQATVVCFTFDDILTVVDVADYDKYTQFVDDFLRSGLRYECAASGNMESAAQLKVATVDWLEQMMATPRESGGWGIPAADPSAIPRFRDAYIAEPFAVPTSPVPAIGLREFQPFNPSDSNTAVIMDLFVGVETPERRAVADCCHQLISSAFFSSLRTKETLGYVVFSHSTSIGSTVRLQFTVQSAVPSADGLYLLSRIHAFFDAVAANLDIICSAAEVESVVRSLIQKRQQKPTSVKNDCDDIYKAYQHPSGMKFNAEEIAHLRLVTAETVKSFFRERIANDAPQRVCTVVMVHSKASWDSRHRWLSDESVETVTVPLPSQLVQAAKEGCDSAGGIDAEDGSQPTTQHQLCLPTYSTDEGETPPSLHLKRILSLEAARSGLSVVRSHTF